MDNREEKNKFWKGVLVGALVMAFAGLIIVGVSSGIFLIGRAVIDNRAQVEQVQGDGKDGENKELNLEFISSKNIVPPLATSNMPALFSAPVKLPFVVPNRILSNSVEGIAAQFCDTNFLFFRLLAVCKDCATNSFPVPDSPQINTEESVFAIRIIFSFISAI